MINVKPFLIELDIWKQWFALKMDCLFDKRLRDYWAYILSKRLNSNDAFYFCMRLGYPSFEHFMKYRNIEYMTLPDLMAGRIKM